MHTHKLLIGTYQDAKSALKYEEDLTEKEQWLVLEIIKDQVIQNEWNISQGIQGNFE